VDQERQTEELWTALANAAAYASVRNVKTQC